jgi:hypothetical protein
MPIAIDEPFFRPLGDSMLKARPLFNSLVLCLVGWGVITPGPGFAGAATPEAENLVRLRSMPREERLALLEKLQEFDALDPAERAAIRALNQRILELPADEQANYWSVLRSYHHWVQGLSEEQRKELNSVPLNQRMKLVSKLRAQDGTNSSTGHMPLVVQLLDFSGITPFEMAHRIKVWLELRPEERTEIELMGSPVEQQRRLASLAQHDRKATGSQGIKKADEDALIAKIEASPRWKNSPINPLKKADPAKQEKMRRRIAASYHFLENPPAAVDPTRLMRFESVLPSWYRGQFDHLPAEEARRRLTILYRLIYPAPGEMPESVKGDHSLGAGATPAAASAPGAGSRASPPPAPPPRSGTNPF